MVFFGGRAWLFWGVCMLFWGGMRGFFQRGCVVFFWGACMIFFGGCVVFLGRGHAWFFGGHVCFFGFRAGGQYASYWNAFLFEYIYECASYYYEPLTAVVPFAPSGKKISYFKQIQFFIVSIQSM